MEPEDAQKITVSQSDIPDIVSNLDHGQEDAAASEPLAKDEPVKVQESLSQGFATDPEQSVKPDSILVPEVQDTPIKTDDVVMDDAPAVEPEEQKLLTQDVFPATIISTEELQISTEDSTSIAFDADFIEAARANRNNPEAEFAEDSDPEVAEDSTDSDDSDSDDSSSDDDSDYGSMILDPEEAARMLMRASPEEGGGSSGPPRTANEQMEKPLPIKQISGLDELKIIELGSISHIIPQINCVVIRATIHHDHNVLQPGSALCLENKTLIRPISDTIAQVHEPYYISYFDSATEISSFGIEEGTKIYYVDHPDHRSYVFYDELRKQKFTDASNLNDEEVDDREMEFSDDEQEAAYKREKKQAKHKWVANQSDDEASSMQDSQPQHGRRGRGRGGNRARAPRGGRGGRGGWKDYDSGHSVPEVPAYAPVPAPLPAVGLDYGDDSGEKDPYYNKLQRPDDYGTWQNTPQRPEIKQEPSSDYRPHSSSAQSSYVPPPSYTNMHTRNNDQQGGSRGRRSNRGYRGGDERRDGQRRHNGSSGQYQQNMPQMSPGTNFPLPQSAFQPGQNFTPQQGPFQPGMTPQQPPMMQPFIAPGPGGVYGFNGGMFPPQAQPQGQNAFPYGGGMPQFGAGSGYGFGGTPQGGFGGFQNGGNGQQSGGGVPYNGGNVPYGGYQNGGGAPYNGNNAPYGGYQNDGGGAGGGGSG